MVAAGMAVAVIMAVIMTGVVVVIVRVVVGHGAYVSPTGGGINSLLSPDAKREGERVG